MLAQLRSLHRAAASQLAWRRALSGEATKAAFGSQQVEHFLGKYKESKAPAFAVIKVGGDVIEYELEKLASTCKALQDFNLGAVVIHGGGPQMNDELKKQGVEPQYIRGSRVTDAPTLAIAERIFTELNERVVKAFQKAGISSKGLPAGIFSAEIKQPELGFVGSIDGVNGDPVIQSLLKGEVPVLTSLGKSSSGQTLNVNADVAAKELVLKLQPMRVLFASSKNGWVDDDTKKIVPMIEMEKDYKRLASLDYTGRQGTLLKLNEIKEILDGIPSSSSVTICGASDMLHALFTHEGSGTVLCQSAEKQKSSSSATQTSRAGLNIGASRKVMNVGLLGARGYVGGEFMNLLCEHPNMKLTVASSRALAGQKVQDVFKLSDEKAKTALAPNVEFRAVEPDDFASDEASNDVDVWVLALPNGLAPRFVDKLEKLPKQSVMIDLGADYRFDDNWAYGLPERHGAREKIIGATRISNPGCYATGLQAALMPIIQPLAGSPLAMKKGTVPSTFGVSGYSGAGTTPSDKNDPTFLKDNLIPYTLVNHMHERECSRHLGQQVAFMPHVAQWFQGIHLTTTCWLENPLDADAVLAEFKRYYEGEALVKVTKEAPLVRDNMFHHHVAVGGFTVDPKTGRLVVVSTIDNLLKGAASQCMQNLNLALGFDQYTAVPLK